METFLNWAAQTPTQVQDYIDALQVQMTVDGDSIAATTTFSAITSMSNGMSMVTSTFNIGLLPMGTHTITTTLTFTRAISDGGDSYGPGTPYDTVQGLCTVLVQ